MKTNYKDLYEKLGYAFYAVASADGHVRKEEEEELKRTIEICWAPLEPSTDEFNTENAHYIFFSFDYCCAEQMNAEEAYNIFLAYFNDHHEAFSKPITHKILSTIYAISNVFRDQNRKEAAFVSRLEQLLKQSHPVK